MKKMRLAFDALQVQSFATSEDEAVPRGTVRGHDAPTDRVECPAQDPAWATCYGSCPENSCGCESAECSVDDCWYTDWGPCTWAGMGLSEC